MGRTRSFAGAGAVIVLAGCASQSAEPAAPENAGPKDWQCQAPEGVSAEDARKVVVIRVLVAKDGSARDVKVVEDPGHGLGPAIVACAKRARYYARDAEGNAIEAWSPPIKVHFTGP